MAERVRRDQEGMVAQFEVPYRGTMQAGGVHRVPKDAVYDSLNIFVRDGKLRARAGTVLLNSSTFAEPVIGAGLAVTPSASILLAVSRSGLHELADGATSWSKTSPSTMIFANNVQGVVEIAYMELGNGTFVALIASDGFQVKQWDSLTHTTSAITPTSGTVPRAKSVCIVGKRVVTLTAPHLVQWSEVDDHKVWSDLSYNKRYGSGDLGIAVRPVGNYGLAVYKERSIHLARVTGQAFGNAFSFGEPIIVEGPAGTKAIATTPVGDIYMTKNGRIGWFDGASQVKWIADGVWTYLQNDIHPSYAYLIRCIYDCRLHTVNFYYPRLSGVGDNRGMVIINLPYEGMDIEGTLGGRPYCFIGASNYGVTAACEMRFNTVINRSILFTTVTPSNVSVYQDEAATLDVNAAFNCMFQTGLVGMPNGKQTRVEFETLLERGSGYGDLTVEPVLSYQLEEARGRIPEVSAQTISLEFTPSVYELLAGTTRDRTRFFGLRYTWSSRSKVRYAGTYCYGMGV